MAATEELVSASLVVFVERKLMSYGALDNRNRLRRLTTVRLQQTAVVATKSAIRSIFFCFAEILFLHRRTGVQVRRQLTFANKKSGNFERL